MEQEQNSPKKQTWLQGFAVAFSGLKVLVANGRNFRIHLLIGFAVIIACALFHVTPGEWITVLLLIAIILSAEAFNTSIEYICDYIAPEYQPIIKKIKDIAAGAVLMGAIIAIIIGCIIFIPYLTK